VDIASMAFSLEARSPFMDHKLVELAARMPIELKFSPGKGKKILIETFQDLIPEPLRNRPKMGFGVPIDHWFRKELRPLLEETILSERSLSRGFFEPAAVRKLVSDHVSGAWDHSYRLWQLVIFEQWHRLFLDGSVPEGPES
jgi:asparagine synthase (glutamine-hydrolysing)